MVAGLERDAVGDGDLEALSSADLVTVTGGIGDVGARTLRTLREAPIEDVLGPSPIDRYLPRWPYRSTSGLRPPKLVRRPLDSSGSPKRSP